MGETNLLEELERRRRQHMSHGVICKSVRYDGHWYAYNGPGDWTKLVPADPTQTQGRDSA